MAETPAWGPTGERLGATIAVVEAGPESTAAAAVRPRRNRLAGDLAVAWGTR